ncbi:MAG: hypothetical protein R2877_07920 [Bdellovibrionota bacterium]
MKKKKILIFGAADSSVPIYQMSLSGWDTVSRLPISIRSVKYFAKRKIPYVHLMDITKRNEFAKLNKHSFDVVIHWPPAPANVSERK